MSENFLGTEGYQPTLESIFLGLGVDYPLPLNQKEFEFKIGDKTPELQEQISRLIEQYIYEYFKANPLPEPIDIKDIFPATPIDDIQITSDGHTQEFMILDEEEIVLKKEFDYKPLYTSQEAMEEIKNWDKSDDPTKSDV